MLAGSVTLLKGLGSGSTEARWVEYEVILKRTYQYGSTLLGYRTSARVQGYFTVVLRLLSDAGRK